MTTLDSILTRLRRAIADEDGTATVDFVVGAAAGVGLAIAIANTVGGAAQDHSDRVGDKMVEIGIPSYLD